MMPKNAASARVASGAIAPVEVYDAEFEQLVESILVRLGEDPQREGLKRTPMRVAKAMDFLTSGYSQTVEEVVRDALFSEDAREMVVVKDIEFYSLCEHHMLPFFGRAHVGYLPNGKVIGLSKIARIVEFYARRPQLQERLTEQIIDFIEDKLQPRGAIAVVEARHLCMEMRGVEKSGALTTTSALRGCFNEQRVREEFFDLLKK